MEGWEGEEKANWFQKPPPPDMKKGLRWSWGGLPGGAVRVGRGFSAPCGAFGDARAVPSRAAELGAAQLGGRDGANLEGAARSGQLRG